jgi:DNA-directed RNA polymerase subunit RPC12/RpoP
MKKTTRNKVYNIKPKNHDISFEYICPECGISHWLTSIEADTKLFKIACDCGLILIPARITDVKFKYHKYEQHQSTNSKQHESSRVAKASDSPTINTKSDEEILSDETLLKTTAYLEDYGFEKIEANELVKQSFAQLKTNNVLDLLRHTLQSLGASNNASLIETE